MRWSCPLPYAWRDPVYFSMFVFTILHLSGASVSRGQPQAAPVALSLEGLRESVRQAMREEPSLFVRPTFRTSGTTLVYSFGGVNSRFLDGPDGEPTALEQLAQTEAVVELMRQATASDANSRGYWGPILDQVEGLVQQGLTRVSAGAPDTLPQDLAALRSQADQLLTDGIVRVATQRAQTAMPAEGPDWGAPVDVVPMTRLVQTSVPVTRMVTQYRTQMVTELVPVTRTITEMVPLAGQAYMAKAKGKSSQPILVPRTRTITEMQKRQVPKQVAVDVPTTTTEARTVQVTEHVSRPRRQCKVTVKTRPDGGKAYYLPRFAYLVVRGQNLADDMSTWQVHWKAADDQSQITLGQSTYYFRAQWDDDRRHRSQRDIDNDLNVTIEPDPR